MRGQRGETVMRHTSIALLLSLALVAPAAAQHRTPTVDDLLNVTSATNAQISPGGKYVAYVVSDTDWKQDAFVTHIWLVNVATDN